MSYLFIFHQVVLDDLQQNKNHSTEHDVHSPEIDNCQKSSVSEAVVQNTDGEGQFVPIVIRPGHIRFEPIGKHILQNLLPISFDSCKHFLYDFIFMNF